MVLRCGRLDLTDFYDAELSTASALTTSLKRSTSCSSLTGSDTGPFELAELAFGFGLQGDGIHDPTSQGWSLRRSITSVTHPGGINASKQDRSTGSQSYRDSPAFSAALPCEIFPEQIKEACFYQVAGSAR